MTSGNEINPIQTDQKTDTSPQTPPATRPRKQWLKPLARLLFPSREEIRTHRTSTLLVFISALSGGLIFHHNALGILGWISLVPLFIALHDLRGKTLFWAMLTFGFIWYYLGVFWLHTLVVFHWMIPLGVLVGTLYVGLYFLLFAIPATWCCRHLKPPLLPWALATCWTGVEFLRNFTDMAFPWNLLGHSQAPWNPIHMQLAAYGGVSMISFLMALINATIAVAIIQLRHHKISRPRLVATTALPAILFISLTILGISAKTLTKPVPALNVSIIQPGVSQLQRWNAGAGLPGDTPQQSQQRWIETETLMLERLATLTRQAGTNDKPQLIVMPESIFMSPGFPYATQLQRDLIALAQEINADLFFGADNLLDRRAYDLASAAGQRFLMPGEDPPLYAIPPFPVLRYDNGTTVPDIQALNQMIPTVAAWHISRTGQLQPRVYNKMQLVPFGEQVPFISSISWLQERLELAGIAGAYRPGLQNTIFDVKGPDTSPFPTRNIPFGTVICFESTFSYLPKNLANSGAEFICVLTNDSWYDPNYAMTQRGFWGTLFHIPGIRQLAAAGPRQHLIHSQFRAIETGRPIVRSANTGTSAFIDQKGHITASLDYTKSGYLTQTLNLFDQPGQPPFLRYGEWLGRLCLGIWAALICLLILARPKSSGKRFALHK